jgi:hypothetical protein
MPDKLTLYKFADPFENKFFICLQSMRILTDENFK